MQVRSYLIAALLIISGVVGRYALGQDHSTSQGKKQPAGLFSPEPGNISNRLYRQVHVRSYDGKEYGFDDLDPLLWRETKYLLSDSESNKTTLDLLDEFLRSGAEKQIRDPVKRAILQRDLWAVFDWASSSNLAEKLGEVIWRLSLTPAEIDALPDTYGIATHRKEFPVAYDPARPNRAFLPPDLFDANGPWVCVGTSDGRLAAPGHNNAFSSRSVFLVFLRLPGGRDVTLAYLNKLAHLDVPPQFPANTEFALVRKLVLPAVNGNLVLTPITESVQVRYYSDIRSPADVSEVKLDRAKLFNTGTSGLREVTLSDKEFPVFMTHEEDPFERNELSRLPEASLATCNGCHNHLGVSGIGSVMSFSFRSQNPRLAETTLSNEAEKVIRWKQADPNWKSLVQLATGESRVRSNQP